MIWGSGISKVLAPEACQKEEYKKLLDKYDIDVVANGVVFEKLESPDSIKAMIDQMKFWCGICSMLLIPHKGDDLHLMIWSMV